MERATARNPVVYETRDYIWSPVTFFSLSRFTTTGAEPGLVLGDAPERKHRQRAITQYELLIECRPHRDHDVPYPAGHPSSRSARSACKADHWSVADSSSHLDAVYLEGLWSGRVEFDQRPAASFSV